MINISAKIDNWLEGQKIILTTMDKSHEIHIPIKESGGGSKSNGGEMLFLALATCYCNDIYREAKQRGIEVIQVEVICKGSFKSLPGSIAEGVTFNAKVKANASETEIINLMKHTDTVSEIQNTLRKGIPVTLDKIEVV